MIIYEHLMSASYSLWLVGETVCLAFQNLHWISFKHKYFLFFHTGIDEISEYVYKDVDHSESEDSDKSDSSDSEYLSDEEHKPKNSTHEDKDKAERKRPKASKDGDNKEGTKGTGNKSTPEPVLKEKQGSSGPDRDFQDKPRTPQSQPLTEKLKAPEEGKAAAASSVAEQDSDSERELVIDLGDEHGGCDSKRARKEPGAPATKTHKESNIAKLEGENFFLSRFTFVTLVAVTVSGLFRSQEGCCNHRYQS